MAFEKILVAIDGSECSNRAFDKALELASLAHASVTALLWKARYLPTRRQFGEVDEVKREKDTFFSALARRARSQAEEAGLEISVEVAGEGGYDLVVLGHRGHFLRNHLLGSTADRVVENAPCPVMIVR